MSLNPIESFQRLSFFFFLLDFLVAFGTSEHSLLKPLLWHHTLVFSSFLGNSFLLTSLLVRLLKLVLFRVFPELSSLCSFLQLLVIPTVSTIIYLLMTPKLIPQVQLFLLTYEFNRLINSSTWIPWRHLKLQLLSNSWHPPCSLFVHLWPYLSEWL